MLSNNIDRDGRDYESALGYGNFGGAAPDLRYLQPGPPEANESDAAFLERLYARTTDPQDRADYGALLRWCSGDEVGDTPQGDVDWALWRGRRGASSACPSQSTPERQRAHVVWNRYQVSRYPSSSRKRGSRNADTQFVDIRWIPACAAVELLIARSRTVRKLETVISANGEIQ